MTNFPISYLKIFTTFRCNLNCQHCVHSSISAKGYNDYPPEYSNRLMHLIKDISGINPGLKIYLSGGEPLLSERFFTMGEILKKLGLSYKTITNGTLLSEKIDELLEAPPEAIWITFNGIGKTHDKIVGKEKAFENLTKNLNTNVERLKKAGIKTGAVYMINNLTCNNLSDDLNFFRNFNFDEVVMQHLSYITDEFVAMHNNEYKDIFGNKSNFCFGEKADGSKIDANIVYREIQKVLNNEYPFKVIVFPGLTALNVLVDYYSVNPQLWKKIKMQKSFE